MITIEESNVYHRRDSGWEGWGDLGFARSYSVYFVRLSPVKIRPCEVFQLSRTNLIITCSSFSMWTLDVVRRISTFHISLSRLIRCSMFGETRASAYHILHNRILILSDNWILTLHHSVVCCSVVREPNILNRVRRHLGLRFYPILWRVGQY